jgi:protease-4
MKQFLKYTLATVVGIIITSVLMTLLFFGILGAVAGSAEKTTSLKPNSVYEIKLEGTLIDRSQDDDLSAALAGVLGQDEQQNIGLDDLLSNIKKAKNDPNILGIYLNGGSLEAGIASIKEMRDALVDFKKSGKFIVAYADNYSQRMYYLATVADRILLNPIGMLEFKGLSAQPTFFKGTLDKLGIEMQVVRVGTFKSAVEPFIDTKMSDANRLQVTEFMGSIWKNMLNEISAARHIPTDSLNSYADQMMMFQATEKALQYKMVDKLLYSQSVDSMIKTVAKKLPKGDELVYVTHSEMKNLRSVRDVLCHLYLS